MRNFLLALCLVSFPLHALSTADVRSEFAASFTSGYVVGKCGLNIERLIRRLVAQGVDVTHTQVGVVTNRGYLFSVTHRRNSGPKLAQPSGDMRFAPGISNFYHHVVLVHDGAVFDYDFGNAPRALPVKRYLKIMFWDEPAITQYTGLEDLRERLNYEIAFVPALQYLETLSVEGVPKLDLGDYYDGLPD